jgi:hypothetical protein
MPFRDRLAFLPGWSWMLWSAVLVVGACGGATPESKTSSRSDGETGSESAPADDAPALPCDDGTCSPCGKAFCPTGYYCDLKLKGGPACEWLPECADQATCGCVTGALGSGCSCEERGGGVYVTCG